MTDWTAVSMHPDRSTKVIKGQQKLYMKEQSTRFALNAGLWVHEKLVSIIKRLVEPRKTMFENNGTMDTFCRKPKVLWKFHFSANSQQKGAWSASHLIEQLMIISEQTRRHFWKQSSVSCNKPKSNYFEIIVH